MPRRRSPPRLYLDPKREQWAIRDGARFIRTGCGERDRAKAEKALADYIGDKHKPTPSDQPLIVDVLNAYLTEVVPTKKTGRNLAYRISYLLPWWGEKTTADISTKSCQAYAAKKTDASAGADLKVLKSAVVHWHKEPDHGPLAAMPIFWLPTPGAPKDRWLSRSEAARLLWAARRHQHLRRAILLQLYTGSRPGVILAMQWSQIDIRGKTMRRIPAGEVQDKKKRAPPVRLGRRILTHLQRWKRLDGPRAQYVCHYDGQRVRDPHKTWNRAVKEAGLKGVTRHTLRHTRATWLLQAGIPIWEAAGHLGMSPATIVRVYGHHSPDHQDRAANV
jgi:integrase